MHYLQRLPRDPFYFVLIKSDGIVDMFTTPVLQYVLYASDVIWRCNVIIIMIIIILCTSN